MEENKKGKIIGVFIAFIDRFYQRQLLKGIKAYCEEQNINVLFFSGRSIQSPILDEACGNTIYDMMNINKIDGLIVATGILANYIGVENVLPIIKSFNSIPIISLSIALPEYHSIILDNKGSIKSLMNHLIHEHNYKQFAYISGPKTNFEAVERLEGYKESLIENGLEYSEEMVYEGTHLEDSAFLAIEYFYKTKKKKPEVIVAGNDDMAMGACKALKEIGLRVPEDVAVTGFDGAERLESFFLPITTIAQPFFEMGYTAADSLHRLIFRLDVEPVIALKGSLKHGESCGCFETSFMEFKSTQQNCSQVTEDHYLDSKDFEVWLFENMNNIIKLMVDTLEIKTNRRYYEKNILELISALIISIKEKKCTQFLKILNRIIQNDVTFFYSMVKWQNALFALKKYVEKRKLCREFSIWINDLFYQANALAGQLMERKERNIHYEMYLAYDRARHLTHAFTSIITIDKMIDLLREQIVKYKFSELYLCIYEKPVTYTNNLHFNKPNRVKLTYGYQNGRETERVYFDTKEMLPDSILNRTRRYELVFMSLFFRFEQFGYIVVDLETADNLIFKALKNQIENYLERKLLFEQLEIRNNQLKNLSLRDALTGLYNRRGFYELGKTAYEHAINDTKSCGIIYCDLDGLKKVNDIYGHHEGDLFIQTIADILKRSCTKDSIIGRVGGDEFVIVVIHTLYSDAVYKTVESIRNHIKVYNEKLNKVYTIGISLGVSVYDYESSKTFEELIKEADAALYTEKKKKKDTY